MQPGIPTKPDWICEFCYTVAYGSFPAGWQWQWQSAVCPSCHQRVQADGGYSVVCGGAYTNCPDPRPWPKE